MAAKRGEREFSPLLGKANKQSRKRSESIAPKVTSKAGGKHGRSVSPPATRKRGEPMVAVPIKTVRRVTKSKY